MERNRISPKITFGVLFAPRGWYVGVDMLQKLIIYAMRVQSNIRFFLVPCGTLLIVMGGVIHTVGMLISKCVLPKSPFLLIQES